jgi:hypothetical protein
MGKGNFFCKNILEGDIHDANALISNWMGHFCQRTYETFSHMPTQP